MKKIIFLLILTLFLVTACNNEENSESPPDLLIDNKEYCNGAQRDVELCYTLYDPVCGHNENNKQIQTYSNICNACKNSEVIFFVRGEC
jgi:hypothetical protein